MPVTFILIVNNSCDLVVSFHFIMLESYLTSLYDISKHLLSDVTKTMIFAQF